MSLKNPFFNFLFYFWIESEVWAGNSNNILRKTYAKKYKVSKLTRKNPHPKSIRNRRPYSQHFIFFITCEWIQQARVFVLGWPWQAFPAKSNVCCKARLEWNSTGQLCFNYYYCFFSVFSQYQWLLFSIFSQYQWQLDANPWT